MEKFEETITKASKIYSEQIILRAGINLIPNIGGSLDLLLSSKGQTFVAKRIENLISELQNELSRLKEEQINFEYLNSEEGFDLIINAFNASAKTRQIEKIKLFSKIIKNAVNIEQEFQESEPELYLRLIDELSLKEIQAGLLLFDLRTLKIEIPNPDAKNKFGLSKTDAELLSELIPEFSEDELITSFLRLERSGLIKERTGNFIGYGGGKYLINETFKKLLNFLDYSN